MKAINKYMYDKGEEAKSLISKQTFTAYNNAWKSKGRALKYLNLVPFKGFNIKLTASHPDLCVPCSQ